MYLELRLAAAELKELYASKADEFVKFAEGRTIDNVSHLSVETRALILKSYRECFIAGVSSGLLDCSKMLHEPRLYVVLFKWKKEQDERVRD